MQYYLYKQDIARIAAMGVKVYSFSISWSRIFPFGRGEVNEVALSHYDDVINTCLEYGVQPQLTFYHWDTPLYLQNLYGGWLSEEIVEDFATYARVLFERYHDRVSHFFTVNEPSVFCHQYPQPAGHFKAMDIPPKQQPYYCGQSVLLAHARAYEIGKSINESMTIAIKNNGGWKIPLTNSSEDATALQRGWDFEEGWWANPLFINGDYPRYLKEYTSTFLRPLNDSEKQSILNTSDIFAHDAYTSQFYSAPDSGISACTSNESHPLYPGCYNLTYQYSPADGGWDVG
jgi:beta-glucosidase/6-phospho-beta-glucosidase/beta-galactosidase